MMESLNRSDNRSDREYKINLIREKLRMKQSTAIIDILVE